MAAANKFNCLGLNLGQKVHLLSGDTFKVMLTLVAPVATNTVKANLTEIAAGNGYTAGGNSSAVTSWSESSGTSKLILVSPTTWTASGGAIANFRYIVLYNDTATNDPLMLWWDYGSTVSLASTETFTVTFDGTNGVLTIA